MEDFEWEGKLYRMGREYSVNCCGSCAFDGMGEACLTSPDCAPRFGEFYIFVETSQVPPKQA